jgi:hypothetical protein
VDSLIVGNRVDGAAAANAGSEETRSRAKLLAVWAIPSFALAFLAFNAWAISTDIENLEHGLRPERLVVTGVTAASALVLATILTVRMRRAKPRHDRVAA